MTPEQFHFTVRGVEKRREQNNPKNPANRASNPMKQEALQARLRAIGR